jgi:hypothetical protein
MINPRDADHALGLELQIEELVEQRQRARVQHREGDADNLDRQITALQSELATSVEQAAAGNAGGYSDGEGVPFLHPDRQGHPVVHPPAG